VNDAIESYETALRLTEQKSERSFITRRLEELRLTSPR
jgi:predicted RNA polymerase sigma factor